jgi:hypothetical protein
MAEGRVKLRELSRGDVFRTADGRLWRMCFRVMTNQFLCQRVGDEDAEDLPPDALVEPLDLPALLAELDELRTLTHDLLIDRDASVGREVGRGQAVAVLNALIETAGRLPTTIHSVAVVRALSTAAGALRALGPVRPLPPPERVAERCRALEGALRRMADVVRDATRYYMAADLRPLDAALEAAEKVLGENPPGGQKALSGSGT